MKTKSAKLFAVCMWLAFAAGLILIFCAPSAGQSAGDRAMRQNGGIIDTAQYERVIDGTTATFRLAGAILSLVGGGGAVAGMCLVLRER